MDGSGEGARRVLCMEAASIFEDRGRYLAPMHGDLVARAGDLVLVEVAHASQLSGWADAMVGLQAPARGRVCFLDNDWAALDAEMAHDLRARIGRVFARGNWLEVLSLLENILLPLMHHTQRPEEELRAEASALARALRLPGLPLGLSRGASRADLERAACVRAFLGKPLLVVLEEPIGDAGWPSRVPLINVIRAQRDRGAAVVWLTAQPRAAAALPATRRYRLSGEVLREVAPCR